MLKLQPATEKQSHRNSQQQRGGATVGSNEATADSGFSTRCMVLTKMAAFKNLNVHSRPVWVDDSMLIWSQLGLICSNEGLGFQFASRQIQWSCFYSIFFALHRNLCIAINMSPPRNVAPSCFRGQNESGLFSWQVFFKRLYVVNN